MCLYIFFVAINQNQLIKNAIQDPAVREAISRNKFKKRDFQLQYDGLYDKIIQKNNLSETQVNFYHDIVRRTKSEFVYPDAKILKSNTQAEENNYLFFIELGECLVSISDKDKMQSKTKNVSTLTAGAIFGEIAFIYGTKRSATVTANNYCTLGKIPAADVFELFQLNPFLKQELI